MSRCLQQSVLTVRSTTRRWCNLGRGGQRGPEAVDLPSNRRVGPTQLARALVEPCTNGRISVSCAMESMPLVRRTATGLDLHRPAQEAIYPRSGHRTANNVKSETTLSKIHAPFELPIHDLPHDQIRSIARRQSRCTDRTAGRRDCHPAQARRRRSGTFCG